MPEPAGLKFSETHEWVKREGEEATVGISEYAQAQLGNVIYVELPSLGQQLDAGGRLGVIESVKAASDLYSPVSGSVTAVNDELKDHPEYVNQDPYGKGWLVKLSGVKDEGKLIDEQAYRRLIEGERH